MPIQPEKHQFIPASSLWAAPSAIKFVVAIAISLIFNISASAAKLPDLSVEELLQELDATLAKSEDIEQQKVVKINSLRNDYRQAADREQRYWIARNLYNEYYSFDSDSAMYYADVAYRIARETAHVSWMDEMLLNKAYLSAATGLLTQADGIMANIDPELLDPSLEARYYETLLFITTHRDQYYGLNSTETPIDEKASAKLDSICRTLAPSDPRYGWFIGWRDLKSSNNAADIIPELRKRVDVCEFNSRNDAMDAWLLSKLYGKISDNDAALRYLIISAIADVRASNKEIASLEEVANILYDEHHSSNTIAYNLKRANDYISYCIQCANQYKSRVRVGRLAELQHKITRAYQTEIEHQEQLASNYLKLLGAILLGLIAAMIFIIVQMKRLRQSRAMLNDANLALNDKVEQLEILQVQLQEANANLSGLYSNAREGALELSQTNLAKEKYIADIFAICSNYISKLDDFRKNIYRLLIAGKYEELREITKSPELSQAEIKELHRTFDKIFLGIYPDFVRDFNSLLRPEEQIELKKDDLLNTELRIYALVRLGLTDSTAIARFLHCSVQTVYNTRQRTRAKAEESSVKFPERVRSLGKTIF
jgi:hypothetical protein